MLNLFKKSPARAAPARLFNFLYVTMWLFVACVSAVDIYWSVLLHEILHETELNPIGSYLIKVNDQKIATFMAMKSIGTSIVLGLLILIYGINRKVAWCVIVGVFVFQLLLMLFLTGGIELTQNGRLKSDHYSEYQEIEQEVKAYLAK